MPSLGEPLELCVCVCVCVCVRGTIVLKSNVIGHIQIFTDVIGHIQIFSRCYCGCSEMLMFLAPTVQ